MTPRQLANLIAKKIKTNPKGFTLDIHTGKEPDSGFFTVGGMVQAYGHFNALYYTPSTNIDTAELIQQLERYWPILQEVGHIGAWVDGQDSMADLFIDSTYLIQCDCGTDFQAARNAADYLGRKNQQHAIGHACDTVKDGYETLPLIGATK